MIDESNNLTQGEKQGVSNATWRVVAHDIRNILAVIKTDVEIALMGATPVDELKKTLVRINAEADKINEKLKEQ